MPSGGSPFRLKRPISYFHHFSLYCHIFLLIPVVWDLFWNVPYQLHLLFLFLYGSFYYTTVSKVKTFFGISLNNQTLGCLRKYAFSTLLMGPNINGKQDVWLSRAFTSRLFDRAERKRAVFIIIQRKAYMLLPGVL